MTAVHQDLLSTLDQSFASAVAAVAPSVLHLSRGHSGGTALAWSEDLAVTSSYHCPDRPDIAVAIDADRFEQRNATVVGRDPGLDLALIRVEGGGLKIPTFRDPSTLSVGTLALAIGRPGRSARASMRIIGVLGKDVRTPGGGVLEVYVDTDRMIPRGFAGGPLVDVHGRVIGMNTRTLMRGHDLAIAAGSLERSIAQLLQHGVIQRGYLGVGVTSVDLSPQLVAAFGKQRGAMISSLDQGGPAERDGLGQGDILVSVAGELVAGPAELRQAVSERPGTTVVVEVIRGGALHSLSVQLGHRP
jgi:S1-C subfamily serine protease